ncbi:hypothetical protein AVEN_69619-1 [Araneus ventricosus]|uniref:Uncharacterized protein n=1 Tax=Araneus ventricosus TaxID=182803 RepID=A0A4Y2G9J9_ARAVE|nr:hypothetical protein AVEN_69619-1 [Araneus ventricosus]
MIQPVLSEFHQHQYRILASSYLEIPVFSLEDQQGANSWLKDFHGLATYNHWDDQMCWLTLFSFAGTFRQGSTTMRTFYQTTLQEFPEQCFLPSKILTPG